MDPDVCRNCGHSGKHIDFQDSRCAITERDDAERDKLQADAALERARQLCESSLSLMKRQMQELEDANAAIEALSRALTAAEDRRERIRRDLGTHGDVCLTARSNLEAAEEMAISAAGRYFEAGRAVTALEEREQLSPNVRIEEPPPAEEMDDAEEVRESEDRKWQRSNERFCKWLRQSEAQRQIMKSSWTKLRVAERLASESVDDEELARRNRVQEWTAARRLTDQLPPEDDPTMETEYLESEPTESGDFEDESKDSQGSGDGTNHTANPGDGPGPTDRAEGGKPDSLRADATNDDEGEEGAQNDTRRGARRPVGKGGNRCQLGWRRAAGGKDTGADREDPGTRGGSDCGGGPAAERHEKEIGEGAAVSPAERSAAMEVRQHMMRADYRSAHATGREEAADVLLAHTQIE
ncbi:UbiD family decarboxylase [Colletotrichum tofieldiae]|uniref:UbiD family decarboxylase n=1 Tax=Colletotrichum tofieldiae TaxID=708197 RepID=A0A166YZP7_9PEZI|nr:UbiD family decarboxylase [Colletotrichum tofieldiae]